MRSPHTHETGIRQTLGFLVMRSQRLMGQQLERAFAELGLTIHQHAALQLLYETLATCPGDIARTLGLDTGSGTRLIDQLAEKGLVTRLRGPPDRRQVCLALTPQGRATAEQSASVSQAYADDLLAGFDADGADALHAGLAHLVRRLEDRADA